MVPTSRRRLLAVGSVALLAGCVSEPPDSATDEPPGGADDGPTATDDRTSAEQGLPEDVRAALEPLPAAVESEPMDVVQLHRPVLDPEDGGGQNTLQETFGLDRDDVDRLAAAYDFEGGTVVTIVGSFAADDPAAPEALASHTEDGLFVGAADGNDEPWQGGLDAARDARDSPADRLLAAHPLAELLAPLVERRQAQVLLDPPAENVPERVDPASLEGIAVGTTPVDRRTSEVTFVVVFADESAASEAALRALVEADWRDVELDDATIEGRRGVATGVHEEPPSPDPEQSPDARFVATYDDETALATVEHRGGESIPAAALQLHVDGEPAPVSWADEYETVEEGDRLSFEAAPFAVVEVRWQDPDDEAVFDVLARTVLAERDAFEAVYDPNAAELTITYRGDQPADTAGLELHHRDADEQRPRGDDETVEPTLAERHGTLTTGDEIVLEDVGIGDSVAIVRRVERERMGFAASVFAFTARAPGQFRLAREDGTTALEYGGATGNTPPTSTRPTRRRIASASRAKRRPPSGPTNTTGSRRATGSPSRPNPATR